MTIKKKTFKGTDKINVKGITVGADHKTVQDKNAGIIVGRISFDLKNVLASSVIETMRSLFRKRFNREPTDAELKKFSDSSEQITEK